VLKEDAVQDLSKALRAVPEGQMFLSPAISSFLLNRGRRLEKLRAEAPGLSRLTPMEVRILTLVAENQTNEEIGRRLFISASTVHTHRNNICTTLNLHGARGLLLFALEHREELRNLRLLPERPG
jgi:two-component system NarL family response regulator